MSGNEIRARFFEYMKTKGHVIIPASPLIPENDSTTLFTGSGMQPLVPFLMGKEHPMGTRIANSQKCFRADDIEEVGDNRHTTFFEMLGNWSFGDYFKREQIPWIYRFLVEEIGLEADRIYVSVFSGDKSLEISRDDEAANLWVEEFTQRNISCKKAFVGSVEEGAMRGMKDDERIFYYDSSKNWWSRVGRPEKMPIGEIGGPDTEMFYDFGTPHDTKFGLHCHPNCDCGRFLEIGNSVFMQYIKTKDGFNKLPKQNVDFGGGLERIAAASLHSNDVFQVDLLKLCIDQIEILTQKKYQEHTYAFRIITDHIRGAVFMISEGVYPSNTEQGYYTRRLLRRAVRYADTVCMPKDSLATLAQTIIDTYKKQYIALTNHTAEIIETIRSEEDQFRKTLATGLREFNKHTGLSIAGEDVFNLFTTYGFPVELTQELAKERGMTVDTEGFTRAMEAHRNKSRSGMEGRFKGGLADNSEIVTMYHTATHLLLAGLRRELGTHVHQAGSNITSERLRFDFTHGEKVSDETLRRVEAYVNNAIQNNASVSTEIVRKVDAANDPTIEGSFWDRYPDQVTIYTIRGTDGTVYSRELCGGPHVHETGVLRGIFTIQREEASAKGIRRIKAVLSKPVD